MFYGRVKKCGSRGTLQFQVFPKGFEGQRGWSHLRHFIIKKASEAREWNFNIKGQFKMLKNDLWSFLRGGGLWSADIKSSVYLHQRGDAVLYLEAFVCTIFCLYSKNINHLSFHGIHVNWSRSIIMFRLTANLRSSVRLRSEALSIQRNTSDIVEQLSWPPSENSIIYCSFIVLQAVYIGVKAPSTVYFHFLGYQLWANPFISILCTAAWNNGVHQHRTQQSNNEPVAVKYPQF